MRARATRRPVGRISRRSGLVQDGDAVIGGASRNAIHTTAGGATVRFHAYACVVRAYVARAWERSATRAIDDNDDVGVASRRQEEGPRLLRRRTARPTRKREREKESGIPAPRRDAQWRRPGCRVHALRSWRRARTHARRPRRFIYITRPLRTRAQHTFSRDEDRWRRLDVKKYINRVNICRINSSRISRNDLSFIAINAAYRKRGRKRARFTCRRSKKVQQIELLGLLFV